MKSNVNDIKSTAAQEAQEERATGIKITTLNRMLQQEQNKEAEAQLLEIKELKERWYTKMELKMQERQGGQPPAGTTTAQQHLLSPSPGIKGGTNAGGLNAGADQSYDQMTTNPSPSVGGSSYNVTRVKYLAK